MSRTCDLFVAAVGVLLAERLRLDPAAVTAACGDVAADHLAGLTGEDDERERAAVARFTEALAGRVAGTDQAMAEAVYDLVDIAVVGVLWPEASDGGRADDLAGWVG